MKSPRAAKPLPYAPDTSPPDERAAHEIIAESLARIQRTTLSDYGWAARGVHAKSHGLLEGELRVLPGLPKKLAQGLFADVRTYPVVMRISTNPGDILDDTVSTPRGMALKVLGVTGERLPGDNGNSQDFVMVNSPAFVAPDAGAFAGSVKLLAATTDTGQGWKRALSAILRGAVRALEALGVEAGLLKALGGQPLTHPLGEVFYAQTPFRYGAHVARFALVPVAPSLTALRRAAVDLTGKPNGLRESVIEYFQQHDAEWELRVQLRTDDATMPLENAAVVWPEAKSPYVTVARVSVPRQPAWSEARAGQVDDALAFSPWNCLAAHEPLGSINRARRDTYVQSAAFRARANGCPISHPAGRVTLSDEPAQAYGATPGREGRRPGTPDARPGGRGQPLSPFARQLAAGAGSVAVLGVVISAALLTRASMRKRRTASVADAPRRARAVPPRPGRLGRGAKAALPRHDEKSRLVRKDEALDAARGLVALGARLFEAARRG